MPNATFIPYVNALLREHNFYKRTITLGMDEDLDILAENILPSLITEVYSVSYRAARIKLEQANFVTGRKIRRR